MLYASQATSVKTLYHNWFFSYEICDYHTGWEES